MAAAWLGGGVSLCIVMALWSSLLLKQLCVCRGFIKLIGAMGLVFDQLVGTNTQRFAKLSKHGGTGFVVRIAPEGIGCSGIDVRLTGQLDGGQSLRFRHLTDKEADTRFFLSDQIGRAHV